MSTETAITELVETILSTYSKEPNTRLVDIWINYLSHLTEEQIRIGAQRLFTEYTGGFPTPAIFLQYANQGDESDAAKAWEYAMRSKGAYQTVCFDNPAITEFILNFGGWPKLCRQDDKSLIHVRLEFIDHYNAYVFRSSRLRPLAGLTEIQMRVNNQYDPAKVKIVFIGDFTETQQEQIALSYTQQREYAQLKPGLGLVENKGSNQL